MEHAESQYSKWGSIMETRKVQKTGGSTFVVSLPKKWVREMGVFQNDPLNIYFQPDGTLSLSTLKERIKGDRVRSFEVSDEPPEHLFRKLIGAYMAGYDVIEVRAKRRLSTDIRQVARKFTQTVIGPEIVEETMSSVTMKDLLNPSDLSFDTSVRRMFYIVRAMHENALTALKERDRALSEDVKSRDQEVDRLNWLIARQFNMMLADSSFSGKMGMTRKSGLEYMLLSRILERIGDHAAKISYFALRVDGKLDKGLIDGLGEVGELCIKLLDGSMDAFFKRRLDASNELIDKVESLFEKCDALMENIASGKVTNPVALSQIIESIRRTGAYARDIAETTINHAIGDGTGIFYRMIEKDVV